ncbi:MAG TPA: hypothetical protein VFV51_13115 [Vicinamibacterales bacterium]|nr:hypothetical protein [Vicinamibacterales bacterium]
MALWLLALSALLTALMSFAYARRLARRLAILEEQYWALKFEHGELKAKVDPPAPPAARPQETFVPLIRLRPEKNAAVGFGGTSPPTQK